MPSSSKKTVKASKYLKFQLKNSNVLIIEKKSIIESFFIHIIQKINFTQYLSKLFSFHSVIIIIFLFLVDQDAKKRERETKKVSFQKEDISSSEDNSESDYEPDEVAMSNSGSSSGSESEAEVIVEKKKKTSNKRKRTQVDEKEKIDKKNKKMKKDVLETSQPMNAEGEKTYEDLKVDEKTDEKDKKSKKTSPPAILFDTGRVDFNLDTENPNNIITKTVQISTSLKMTCKMVAGAAMSSGRISYPDWAALVFKKKIKDGKCFEFNVSLKDAPRIVEGLKYIIDENKKFFQ